MLDYIIFHPSVLEREGLKWGDTESRMEEYTKVERLAPQNKQVDFHSGTLYSLSKVG